MIQAIVCDISRLVNAWCFKHHGTIQFVGAQRQWNFRGAHAVDADLHSLYEMSVLCHNCIQFAIGGVKP